MVETLLNVPTGAPKAPDNTRPHGSARSHTAGARVQGSPFNTQYPVTNSSSTVALDALLAAQQARQQTRETSRPPAFDARLIYAFERPSQDAENKRQSAHLQQNGDGDGDGDGHGAEIIPFRSPIDANGSFNALDQEGEPLTLDLSAETAQFFEPSTSDRSGAQSAFSTPTHNVPSPREDFIRANKAYVHAGAADGRAFAASGLDTSAVIVKQSAFNLII
jgi:hypothetical protein